MFGQLTAVAIDRINRNLVIVLQTDIERTGHRSLQSSCSREGSRASFPPSYSYSPVTGNGSFETLGVMNGNAHQVPIADLWVTKSRVRIPALRCASEANDRSSPKLCIRSVRRSPETAIR